jgi:hypothetical protein
MAAATFLAIDAHSATGEFKITITYDDVTLLMQSVSILNTSGVPQQVTVSNADGSLKFDTTIQDGVNRTDSISALGLHMILTHRGPAPPIVIS